MSVVCELTGRTCCSSSPPPPSHLPCSYYQVTHYALASEILRGRRKRDTPRIIAVVLVGFSISSWVLELSLALANVKDGPVDMMDRPPPVLFMDDSVDVSVASWKVMAKTG